MAGELYFVRPNDVSRNNCYNSQRDYGCVKLFMRKTWRLYVGEEYTCWRQEYVWPMLIWVSNIEIPSCKHSHYFYNVPTFSSCLSRRSRSWSPWQAPLILTVQIPEPDWANFRPHPPSLEADAGRILCMLCLFHYLTSFTTTTFSNVTWFNVSPAVYI